MSKRLLERRNFLLAGSVMPLAAGAISVAPRQAKASVKTSAKIVIAGSGLAGLAVANRLSSMLDGAKITVIDRKEVHNYQPGYTLVATGIWPASKVIDQNADLMPKGVEWVKEMAAEFDPEANAVVTDTGKRISYDYLVVATGVHLDYAQIKGMDIAAIGTNGLGSVYHSSQAAQATWGAIEQFRQKGGQAVMTLPATPIKCAGAPLKMTFLLADRLRQSGTKAASKITFHSALGVVFGVPKVNEEILKRWSALDISTVYTSKLDAVDIGARKATFLTPEGDKEEVAYDFLHVVPPMRAPDSIKNSALGWKEGNFAAGGWLEVDKDTLRHRRYANVFGVGDINGTPRGKTAATVKKSAPLVAQNLVDVIAGKEPSQKFDGYTSCPLIVRDGSALLLEFDYAGNLVPSIPFIDPMQESYLAWLMKYQLLKPAYMAVAKGRV